MDNRITGLHHITAIAGEAQRNYDFYTRVLGLRLVKKTVNFDDPGTYHFYYGDKVGSPGTILTFFPWQGIQRGRTGTGMATEIGYSVPKGSLDFWKARLESSGVHHQELNERMGERYLQLEDVDGLVLNLIENAATDDRQPWTTNEVSEANAIKGFHSVVLTVRDSERTAKVLTDIFGYQLTNQDGEHYRFTTDAVTTANLVDIMEDPTGFHGINAGGTNHHVAFRVPNEDVLMHFREKVRSAGLNITEKIDRNYFYSLYFREPGGILFEIATDNPGFAIDESVEELGTHLMLPKQYENSRSKIEEILPALQQ